MVVSHVRMAGAGATCDPALGLSGASASLSVSLRPTVPNVLSDSYSLYPFPRQLPGKVPAPIAGHRSPAIKLGIATRASDILELAPAQPDKENRPPTNASVSQADVTLNHPTSPPLVGNPAQSDTGIGTESQLPFDFLGEGDTLGPALVLFPEPSLPLVQRDTECDDKSIGESTFREKLRIPEKHVGG